MNKSVVLLFLISLLYQFEIFAGEKLFESGKEQVALIELYSSEGCSSCPPADRWVAGLKDHAKLWQEFVPINFHVDYWNRLGWVDRFSNKLFTERQHRFASEWGSGRVYTPGFVKNGLEWRSRSLDRLKGSAVGNLIVEKAGGKKIKVIFTPEKGAGDKFSAHLALLGHGLSTEVKYGENAGETLHHEFVVLKQAQGALKKEGHQYILEMILPENKQAGAKKQSLAVWISRPGSQKPVQATGGYLAQK